MRIALSAERAAGIAAKATITGAAFAIATGAITVWAWLFPQH